MVEFIEKWCAGTDPRALVLTYEDLLSDPVRYYRGIFERFGLLMEAFDAAAVEQAQAVSSGDERPFRERRIEQSRHFEPQALAAFQHLLASAAALPYGGGERA